jgi:hypothetical protein
LADSASISFAVRLKAVFRFDLSVPLKPGLLGSLSVLGTLKSFKTALNTIPLGEVISEPIYEQDFDDCSYGFRPGRSTHQAIAATWKHTMDLRGGFVLEVDLRKFFDTLDHGHLCTFLQRRVRDGVILRLIGKWLNAGVMDSGSMSYPDRGSPQGGVVSPLLANVYLHYVLDKWFHRDVLPRMRARAHLVQYAMTR